MNIINGYFIEVDGFTSFSVPQDELLETMYGLLECNLVQAVDIETRKGEKLTLWIDEDALLKREMLKPRFEIHGLSEPLMGNLIVTGQPDEEGNTTSAPLKLDQFSFIDSKGAMIGGFA